MILKNRKKLNYEFYTETKEGIETVITRKMLKSPDTCKLYLDMQKKGFVNGIHTYGFRLIEE